MKKKLLVILTSLVLLFGFGAVAPVVTAAPADAVSYGTCHKRQAYDFWWESQVEYTIWYKNFSAWEEWTNHRNRDGFYITHKRQLVWPYVSGGTNEYLGTSFPTWGRFIRWC